MLSEVHCKSINFYHKAKEAADHPQKPDLLPYHVKLHWPCCYESPFPYSFMQKIVGAIANPDGQPPLGLITQAVTLKSMTNLPKTNRTQKHILGQLFPVFHQWKSVTVEGMYYFLINHINSFMPNNLNYHFLVTISISCAVCCKYTICEEALYSHLKYFV